MQSLRPFLLAALALLVFAGCANYQWSRPALPFKTLYVQPATNDGFAPQAQASLSSQIRQAFIRDGRLKIVSDPANAEAILQVNLNNYRRNAASRRSDDNELALSFDLVLQARIVLYNPAAGSNYFEPRELSARTSTFASQPNSEADSFSRAEYQVMPRLTSELANKIADEVLSVW
jgi:hypothetical protein